MIYVVCRWIDIDQVAFLDIEMLTTDRAKADEFCDKLNAMPDTGYTRPGQSHKEHPFTVTEVEDGKEYPQFG